MRLGYKWAVFAKKKKVAQGEFWVASHQLPTSAKVTFYSRLDETLESFGFADKVRALCAPAYIHPSSQIPCSPALVHAFSSDPAISQRGIEETPDSAS
jgi:hypothetical protein